MTYSILARDGASGHIGVATQSQALAVGSSVSWAMPGVGAIATQSMGEPMYGELGLDALQAGLTAEEALTALRTIDPHPERRQVAMIDHQGRSAVYTGEACVAEAGHAVGDGCVAVANLMQHDGVWDAMVAAYEDAPGALPDRLLAAMDAAEDAGGDLRGQRSASILVVRAERSGRPWRDQLIDLRVDDHPAATAELRRLVETTRRYHVTVTAFEAALDGRTDDALDALPDGPDDPVADPDLALWRAVVLAVAGRDGDARALGERLAAGAPAFTETARRFPAAGLISAELLARILPDGR